MVALLPPRFVYPTSVTITALVRMLMIYLLLGSVRTLLAFLALALLGRPVNIYLTLLYC